MKVVIIEDEPLMALDLAADLLELRPHWQVVATLSSVRQAQEWLGRHGGYDVIFSDIQLGDGKCFDAFARVTPAAPVIFCTAYDQYAIQAFEANGIGYLLKPYGRDSLRAAIEKFERLRQTSPQLDEMRAFLQTITPPSPQAPNPSTRILVHHKDKIIPVPIAQVALFYLHHEQTMLLRLDGTRFPCQQTLGEIEVLAGPAFFRASRQHLVQRVAVREATHYFQRKLLLHLTLQFEEEITISKEKVAAFLAWLAGD